MYIFFKASQAPIKLWWPLVDVGDPQNQRANVEKPEAVRKCQHRQMCWWKFYFILNILQYWMIKRGKKYGDWFLHHQSVQHTGKIKKFKKKQKQSNCSISIWTRTRGFVFFFFKGSCIRVLMCLAGWDHMVENWAVGRHQNTNTFKVSGQTETDSSSAGTCRRPARICRPNRVCRRIQQICLEGWRLYNHRNHCSLHGPILSEGVLKSATSVTPGQRSHCCTDWC